MNDRAKDLLKSILAGLALGIPSPAAPAQSVSPFNLPLYFEANKNQTEFLSRGGDCCFSISPSGAQIALRNSTGEPATVRMKFAGANGRAKVHGGAELPGKISYLTGNDPATWQTGLPTFGKVGIAELYPGIQLLFYGNQRQLEYDFTIAPGANPRAIKIHFDGADKIYIAPAGDLVLKVGDREIRQPKPEIYQTAGGARKGISGGYKILDPRTVVFEIGNYDHSLPLVIDPVLNYSTYFGGTAGDRAWSVALDTNGFIYVAGETFSRHIVTNGWSFSTPGAFQTNYNGGKYDGDAFVAKFGSGTNSIGTNLIYLTYLGGDGDNAAYSLAVDGSGDAFVAGYTDATNFPVTNAIPGHAHINGKIDKHGGLYPSDAFVTELDASGSNLIYSTYLGGESADAAYGIAVDSSDNAYVTGYTYSTNFPVTAGALQSHLACSNSFYLNANAFVAEITNGGGALVYSTYLGGTNYDVARCIAVDGNGYVYVAGYTASTNFPTWNVPTNLPNGRWLNGATNKNGSRDFDAFVTKFPPLNGPNPPSSVTNLIYSTYLGGTNRDKAFGIAADASGCAYVTGGTSSTNFPDTMQVPGLFSYVTTNQSRLRDATNVFLTKIADDGSAVDYSVVFGNRADDVGYGIAVDTNNGNVFIVGTENSTNFPTTNTVGYLRATNSGKSDVFVTAFTNNCSALLYSVLLGGRSYDYGYGIALDSADDAYIVGQTLSTNFPTIDARQTFRNDTNDAFLAEIIMTGTPPAITTEPLTNQTVGAGTVVNFAVTATGTAPLNFQWQMEGTNLVNGGRISGATNATLTISNAHTNDSGNYWVIVTNYEGAVTSSIAVLTVTDSPPIIRMQPANQTVGAGSVVTFAVTATGTEPLSYHWQMAGTNLVDGGRISGTADTTLTISNAQMNDSGTRWIAATNNWGAAVSSKAVLTVLSSPKFTEARAADGGRGGLILSGVGGRNGGNYVVLSSSNVLTPLRSWTRLATNHFGGQGQFTFTNAPQTNMPQLFYILQMQ